MQNAGFPIKGIYRDRLFDSSGELIYDSGWNNNTIVNSCREMIARFMKNEDTGSHPNLINRDGIRFIEVGFGDSRWDNGDILKPKVTETGLLKPYEKIEIENNCIEYLDGSRTCLQVKCTLKPGVPGNIYTDGDTTELREFGLWGVFRGTEYLINCVRHPLISKDKNTRLDRVIRLYFGANQE